MKYGTADRAALAVLAAAGLMMPALVAFTVRERPARSPALPPSLLRSRPMSGGAVIGLLFNFGFYGMIFTASLQFQHQRGFSALGTGLALFPAVAMTMFASVLSGRLTRRTGDRPLVVSGMLLGALGLAAWAAAGAEPAYAVLVVPMIAAGFGTSFALTGATATVMGAAPPAYSGAASALFNTTRQIGSATGVALGGSLLATGAGYAAGLHAWYYGDGAAQAEHLVQHLIGTALKDAPDDLKKLRHYFNHAVKGRSGEAWKAFYEAREQLP